MNLHEYVVAELKARKGSWPKIGQETGIGYSYICKLATGRIEKPSYDRLQEFENYFKKNQAA